MPWTRPNRWVLSLLLLAAFAIGMAVHVVVAQPHIGDTGQRVVTTCLMFAAVVLGFARMEIVTRQKAHDLANGQNTIANVVDKRLNGDLDKRISGAVAKVVSEELPVAIDKALEAKLEPAIERICQKFKERN